MILTVAFSSTNNGCSILSDVFFSVIAFVMTVILAALWNAYRNENIPRYDTMKFTGTEPSTWLLRSFIGVSPQTRTNRRGRNQRQIDVSRQLRMHKTPRLIADNRALGESMEPSVRARAHACANCKYSSAVMDKKYAT